MRRLGLLALLGLGLGGVVGWLSLPSHFDGGCVSGMLAERGQVTMYSPWHAVLRNQQGVEVELRGMGLTCFRASGGTPAPAESPDP